MSEAGRSARGEVGRAQAVASIADAFVDASSDITTLESTIVEQISRALHARCALSDEARSEVLPRRIALQLRRVDRALIVSRDDDAPAFCEGDRELLSLLSDHAAIALANATTIAELGAARRTGEIARAETRGGIARFASLDQAGMLGVVVATLDGRIVEINHTLARLLGYTREEVLGPGFDWPALTPPEFRDVDARVVASLREEGRAPLREKQYIRKDGTRVWVMLGSAMLDDSSQSAISFVLDIDERKVRDVNQRLQLAAIVESSADAIIAKTLDGVITSWNRGAYELFGYTAAEAIGQPVMMLVPSDREREAAELLDHLRHGEATRFESARRCKDGREIDVAVTSSPMFDIAGNVVGASEVARDITERRSAERAVAMAKDAADAASRELEAFSYSVAHDLRAPLRGIDAFARFLLDDYADKLDAEGRDHLDEIRSNAKKMSELIDALLSLSRVTRSDLRRESTDLAALVRAAVTDLASTQPERQVEVVVGESLRANVDHRLARSLIANLVGNAWKFTGNTPHPRIEVGTAGDPAMFFVRDNGAGFDMAYAKNLFAPFQRMHTVREFPGTGIGLATVQRIVHRHGGRIWAEAAVNAGATFFFTLPEHHEVAS